MSTCKFYFYNRDGLELTATDLNGCGAGGTGAGIATNGGHMDREPKGTMWKDSKGRIARTEISRQSWTRADGYDAHKITIADFPGHTAVLVKFWAPNRECIEYFWLISEEGCKAIGAS